MFNSTNCVSLLSFNCWEISECKDSKLSDSEVNISLNADIFSLISLLILSDKLSNLLEISFSEFKIFTEYSDDITLISLIKSSTFKVISFKFGNIVSTLAEKSSFTKSLKFVNASIKFSRDTFTLSNPDDILNEFESYFWIKSVEKPSSFRLTSLIRFFKFSISTLVPELIFSLNSSKDECKSVEIFSKISVDFSDVKSFNNWTFNKISESSLFILLYLSFLSSLDSEIFLFNSSLNKLIELIMLS